MAEVVLAVALIARGFHPIYLVACIVGIACTAGYLLLRSKLNLESSDGSWAVYLTGALVFTVVALTSYLLRPAEYIKPLSYYVLSAIAVAFVFGCATVTSNSRQSAILLALIVSIGLMHVWTESMMFPSVIGIDAWTHERITTQELAMATGTQPNVYDIPYLTWTTIGAHYSLMHVYIAKAMQITGMGYKMSTLIFWSSLQVVANAILAYLIGSELLSRKVGLTAALMIVIANWILLFNEWAIPNSSGVALSLAVAYLGISWHRTHSLWLALVILLVMAISFTTHLLSSVWVVGIIVCIFILPQLLTSRNSIRAMLPDIAKASILPIIVLVALVAWFQMTTIQASVDATIAAGGIETFAIGDVPGVATNSVGPSIPVAVDSVAAKVSEQLRSGSLIELMVGSLGMFLYMGLAIVGCLFLLRVRPFALNTTWVILCMGVLVIGFLPYISGISVIEHRWWYLAEGLMSIPLGAALLGLSGVSRHYFARITIVVLVGVVAFLSTIGLPSNLTNRTLSPNLIVRYGLTAGEMEAKQIAEAYKPNVLGVDPYYMAYLQADAEWLLSPKRKSISLEKNILSGEFGESPSDVIILRDALYTEPLGYGGGTIYRLGYNPIEQASKQGYTKVWENGEACVLIRTKR